MARRKRRRSSPTTIVSLVALLLVVVAAARCGPSLLRRELPFAEHAPNPRPPPPSASPSASAEHRLPPSTPRQPSVAPSGSERLASSLNVALGIPIDADPSDDVLLDRQAYVTSYNPNKRVPNWVSWRLERGHLGPTRRRNDFRSDRLLPAVFPPVSPSDYANSGYDRGHLCPSADRTDTAEHNSATFLMTNMLPQLHELNAGPWEKLEEQERRLASSKDAELFIVAGGLFAPRHPTIGKGVAVPRATYKLIVVLRRGQRGGDVTPATRIIAVSMPNEPWVAARPWTEFVTSVDELERETGYDFLSNVPEQVQAVVEARVARGN